MWKKSVKLYLVTLIFTSTLTSFASVGEVHFPVDPPPDDDRASVPLVTSTDVFVNDGYQFLNGIREFLAEIAN